MAYLDMKKLFYKLKDQIGELNFINLASGEPSL
ncbi:hypothetical protein SATMO3_06120 [Sporomusa aerivorans]